MKTGWTSSPFGSGVDTLEVNLGAATGTGLTALTSEMEVVKILDPPLRMLFPDVFLRFHPFSFSFSSRIGKFFGFTSVAHDETHLN